MTTLVLVAALLGAACSDKPRLAPVYDESPLVAARPEPQVFASGTVVAGSGNRVKISWDLEEIVGFSHAVSLTTASDGVLTVRSVSRHDLQDTVWFVGTLLTNDGPPMVFGGADGAIDSVLLVNDRGDEVVVELIALPDRDWNAAVEQLPADWMLESNSDVEVVALRSGAEVAREPLSGLVS